MTDFINSARSDEGSFLRTDQILDWFRERQQAHQFLIEEIPFSELHNWSFEPDTGNLLHASGKFFSIEGVHGKMPSGVVPEWQQPIINQPEIGFLGFIVKKFDGVLHFLVQAKMEPGNINMIQLSPTLQATRSNFTRAHQGRTPRYLEYFIDRTKSKVLADSLQSEQGARFLRKRNRNIVVEIDSDLPPHDDFCWLTLGQIKRIMRIDNVVNMDARTVISCIPLDGAFPDIVKGLAGPHGASDQDRPLHSNSEILSWFTEQKFNSELSVAKIPLKTVKNWVKTDRDIHHEFHRHFSVIACKVEAGSREVSNWTQPMVKAAARGILGFIVKNINGTLHFLMRACVELGNFDTVEFGPTIMCIPGSYRLPPPFLEYVLGATKEQIRFDTLQSEEGGRFFREESRNIIVEADEDFPIDIPEGFIWMTARQLGGMISYNNFVNIQARCLYSTLSLV
jgi:oxidase EvaA